MTINIGHLELSLLRERLASVESRLREETTTHAHTRELLQEAAARPDTSDLLRLVLDNMPVMMNAFDVDGVCVAWNIECERVTGYSPAEMIGNANVPDLVMPDAVYRARMMELWPSKKNTREWEVDLLSKDGRARTIAWSNISETCPISGWEIWAIGVDVTDRNHALEQLRAARLEVEQRVRQRTAELEMANERLRSHISGRESSGTGLPGPGQRSRRLPR